MKYLFPILLISLIGASLYNYSDAPNGDAIFGVTGSEKIVITSDTLFADITEGCCYCPPTEEPTGLDCWETATFNDYPVCEWEISGTQPGEPTDLQCWQTARFDYRTCEWGVTGTEPQVDDNCEITDDSFNEETCTVVNTPNCPSCTTYNEATCACDEIVGGADFAFDFSSDGVSFSCLPDNEIRMTISIEQSRVITCSCCQASVKILYTPYIDGVEIAGGTNSVIFECNSQDGRAGFNYSWVIDDNFCDTYEAGQLLTVETTLIDNESTCESTITGLDKTIIVRELTEMDFACCPVGRDICICPKVSPSLRWRVRDVNNSWRARLYNMNLARNAVAALGSISNEVRTYTINGVTNNLSSTLNAQSITIPDNSGDAIINYSFTLKTLDGCAYNYSADFHVSESNVVTGAGWQPFQTEPVNCSPIN